MKPQTTPFLVQPDPQQPKQANRPLLPDEDELTDEEAFYAAQEVAFAALKARHQARPRRKR